ncbi:MULTISPECIES: phage virion morphogenesis protein [Amycolatopsis]|uniref:HK97 gp10 family phage protein n=1 Tax=Amycolatopsis albidoflavus TaxID=102226 RepID=A0ABW5I4X9_9PSEU
MVSIEMRLSGVDELQAALAAAVERMDTVTREATAAAASLVEIAVKDKLRQSSHRRGTPTPSSPGQPPALVSGNLMRSIAVRGPTGGLGVWGASIGPTAIYGRIQELGGMTGRHHAAHLPPRPYADPAAHETFPIIESTYLAAWATIFG